jgi:hypothetical protein
MSEQDIRFSKKAATIEQKRCSGTPAISPWLAAFLT